MRTKLSLASFIHNRLEDEIKALCIFDSLIKPAVKKEKKISKINPWLL